MVKMIVCTYKAACVIMVAIFLKTVIKWCYFLYLIYHYIYFIVLFMFTLFMVLLSSSCYNLIAIVIIQLVLWQVTNRLIKPLEPLDMDELLECMERQMYITSVEPLGVHGGS